jgi:hypothetical protein
VIHNITEILNVLLMMMCFAGFSTLHIIMVVSKLPLATSWELGDQATVLTLALWKPHSFLWASCNVTVVYLHYHNAVGSFMCIVNTT